MEVEIYSTDSTVSWIYFQLTTSWKLKNTTTGMKCKSGTHSIFIKAMRIELMQHITVHPYMYFSNAIRM
jgi:hypothetical protein